MSVTVQTADGAARVGRGDLHADCGGCGHDIVLTVGDTAYEWSGGRLVRHTCPGARR